MWQRHVLLEGGLYGSAIIILLIDYICDILKNIMQSVGHSSIPVVESFNCKQYPS